MTREAPTCKRKRLHNLDQNSLFYTEKKEGTRNDMKLNFTGLFAHVHEPEYTQFYRNFFGQLFD